MVRGLVFWGLGLRKVFGLRGLRDGIQGLVLKLSQSLVLEVLWVMNAPNIGERLALS